MKFKKTNWHELTEELQTILDETMSEAVDHHTDKLYNVQEGIDLDKPMEWFLKDGEDWFNIANLGFRTNEWTFKSEPFNVKG